jgi:hypothetical protein
MNMKVKKESTMICYCFEYTELDIRNDVFKNNGPSPLLDRIKDVRKQGTCQCDVNNPKGT